MYRAIIISPNAELGEYLTPKLNSIGGIGVVRGLAEYPESLDLIRLVRVHLPQMVFLSLANLRAAGRILEALHEAAPGIQVLAINESYEQALLLEAMRMGIREFLAAPFEEGSLRDALARCADALSRNPVSIESTNQVFSFLPAKPGVGTTTLAVSIAVALSNLDQPRTLLVDLDLNSGLIQFMLKLETAHSVIEAAEHSVEMDEKLWPQMVSPIDNLDILHAGGLNPHYRIEPAQMRNLMDFARRNYRAICADLSGNLERYSVEVMHESRIIFVVCTGELPSLHLAREKCRYIESLELGDRIRILVNRSAKRSVIADKDIEEVLGRPVHMKFVNDYQCVHRAISSGRAIDPSSELGKQCTALARTLLDKQSQSTQEGPRRFVEYFSLSPARYSFGVRR
jgi:pilus assembly protein CpaE